MSNSKKRSTWILKLAGAATLALSLAAASAPTTAPSASSAKSLSPQIMAEAQRVLGVCKQSKYVHKTDIKEDAGVYNTDCSGLVTYVMTHVAPKSLETVPHGKNYHPLASHFYKAFTSDTPGWVRIDNVLDAQPGDVLAWKKHDYKPGDNTGHVMIISAKPVLESPRLARVAVIDSTTKIHADDTRTEGKKTGLGTGTLWLDLDEAGHITAHRVNSPTGEAIPDPAAIGRAVEMTGDAKDVAQTPSTPAGNARD